MTLSFASPVELIDAKGRIRLRLAVRVQLWRRRDVVPELLTVDHVRLVLAILARVLVPSMKEIGHASVSANDHLADRRAHGVECLKPGSHNGR